MDEQKIIEKLKSEGWNNVGVYEDGSNEVDEEHKHDYDTILHIISGDIKITILENNIITDYGLKVGDEKIIFKNQLHSAKTGEKGCRYVVGERK